MPINVICPGCHSRFQVSDKFAGRSGACPKCKGPIKVPTKEEEVQVHAPEEFGGGGRGTSGRLILKPISREKTKFSIAIGTAVVAIVLVIFALAWLGGGILRDFLIVRATALLAVAFLLAWAGYFFLRDDENLETYSGKPLWVRTAICAAAYTLLWGVFGYVAPQVITEELYTWLLVAPPFVISGGLIALACYDLDFGNGCFHFAFYLLVTILLRVTAGMGWIWNIGHAAD
ncbi:MAG TPA: hypothetical protein DD670_03415 [Planctomycetaceae bacterium]|nr:hypothetical protein [Planctomycetaceae bacterium]